MPDVPLNAWYWNNLGYCLEVGIFTGYPDGSFGPENEITRAEFAAIVARLIGVGNTGVSEFEDVTDLWAEGYIAVLTQKGIITGNSDGTFAPLRPITRAEAVTMLNRALDREPDNAVLDELVSDEEANTFSDVLADHWAYYQVLETSNDHKHK